LGTVIVEHDRRLVFRCEARYAPTSQWIVLWLEVDPSVVLDLVEGGGRL
jgi:hypothetical protein